MTTLSTTPPVTDRSRGRGYFWAGVGACLLGLALAFVQFRLGYLRTPWYSPGLATVGALLLVFAVARRVTVVRVLALLLVVGLAGFQWFALGWLMRLPAYEGTVRAGERFPAFSGTKADGSSFSDADLRDGSRHVMVFFRGRW